MFVLRSYRPRKAIVVMICKVEPCHIESFESATGSYNSFSAQLVDSADLSVLVLFGHIVIVIVIAIAIAIVIVIMLLLLLLLLLLSYNYFHYHYYYHYYYYYRYHYYHYHCHYCYHYHVAMLCDLPL